MSSSKATLTLDPLIVEKDFNRALAHMLSCDAVSVGEGWTQSPRSRLLVQVALEIGLALVDDCGAPLSPAPDFVTDAYDMRDSILVQADRLINGPRRGTYGSVNSNFSKTAAIWNGYLFDKLSVPLTVVDCVWLHLLAKVARQKNMPYKPDNVRDVAGYAGLIAKLQEEDK